MSIDSILGASTTLCERFAAEGARGVVVSDIDADGAVRVADAVGGMAIRADAGNRADVHTLVVRAEREYGQIDLFCCNAGIFVEGGGWRSPTSSGRRSGR